MKRALFLLFAVLLGIAAVQSFEDLFDSDDEFADDVDPTQQVPIVPQQQTTPVNPIPYHVIAKCPQTVPALGMPFLTKTHSYLLDLFQKALRAKKTNCKRVVFLGNVHLPSAHAPPVVNELPDAHNITVHFNLPHFVQQHYLVNNPLVVHHVPHLLYNWAGYSPLTPRFNPSCMIHGSLPSDIFSSVHINLCETQPHPHVVIHHPAGTLSAIPLLKALEYHPPAQRFISANPLAARPYSHVVIFDSNLADGSGLQHIFG